jgi:hypothetical protein
MSLRGGMRPRLSAKTVPTLGRGSLPTPGSVVVAAGVDVDEEVVVRGESKSAGDTTRTTV